MEKQRLPASCREGWNTTYINDLGNGCSADFDGFICWPPTASNETSFMDCPAEFMLLEKEYGTSRRYCFPNGSWGIADYTECLSNLAEFYSTEVSSLRHLKAMYYIYWVGYTVSLMFLLAALAIFVNYRSLWCLRNIIHSNLILCFACHCATWIAYSAIAYEILMKHLLYEFVRHCFIATILLKYFVTAGFFWMFVEGLYLLVSVRFSFRRDLISYTLCASIGWGIPLLLITVSSAIRAQTDHEGCWNEPSPLDYIFLGPVVAALFVNFFVLVVVLRVLVRQLKMTGFEEGQKLKKIAKGLFVLCPLLGTSYVFTLVPPHHPQWLVLVFSYITTILTSTQGILIAVLFCFSNSEVIFCIKKSYSQYLERWHPRRCSSCYMKLFGSLSETSRETSC